MTDAADPSTRDTGVMDATVLAQADRIVAGLSAGKRESIREVIINAMNLGFVSDAAQRFLERATGSTVVGDVLVACVMELSETGPRVRGSATIEQ